MLFHPAQRTIFAAIIIIFFLQFFVASSQAQDSTNATILLGGSMDLKGDARFFNIPYKEGIEAALQGELVKGRRLQYEVLNDFYDPSLAIVNAKNLLARGIFAMVGNFGTPTTAATMPLLIENKIPMIGFISSPGIMAKAPDLALVYHASIVAEISTLVELLLDTGLQPGNICAFAQNDSFGMTAALGMKAAYKNRGVATDIITLLEQIIATSGEPPQRNLQGPIGVHGRNINRSREAYESLLSWEIKSGTDCQFIVTASIDQPIANFIAYSRYKEKNWLFSSIATRANKGFFKILRSQGIKDGIVFTQVVPSISAPLPIVEQASAALGKRLNPANLEGFIVGKMTTTIMQAVEGELTPQSFLDAAHSRAYDIGGISVDFSNSFLGTKKISFAIFAERGIKPLTTPALQQWVQQGLGI